MLEKKRKEVYLHVSDDESSQTASEHERLMDDELWHTLSRNLRILNTLTKCLVGIVYSLTLITVTSMWWKNQSLHGANVISCRIILCVEVYSRR